MNDPKALKDLFQQAARNLASTVATAVRDHLLRFHPETRTLSFSQHVISLVAGRSLKALEDVSSVQTSGQRDSFHLKMTTHSGITLETRLRPSRLEISGDTLTFHSEAPEGFKIQHRSPWKNAAISLVGSRRLLERKLGLEFQGNTFCYSWAIPSSPASRVISQLLAEAARQGLSVTGPIVIPLRFEENWLKLDLSQIVPEDFQIDTTALASLLQTQKS